MINKVGRPSRWAATAAVVTLAGISVTACSSSGGGGASGPGAAVDHLRLQNPSGNEHYYQDAAAAYEKAHPGVKITSSSCRRRATPRRSRRASQGGNAPDVFQAESGSGQTDSIQNFAKAGLLLPLTDPAVKTELTPAGLSQFQYNGKIYAVSIGSAVNGIVYNDQLAKAAGVTLTANSTFSDVLQACATAKAKGKSLFGLAGSAAPNTGILALEIATSAVYGADPDWDAQRTAGKVKFATTPGWTTTLNSIVQLYKAGCFQPGAQSAGFDALTNGSSRGQLFGFFAPSGAAHDISVASGGHVNLVALPFPAPSGRRTRR